MLKHIWIAACLVAFSACMAEEETGDGNTEAPAFSRALNFTAIERLAVQDAGRKKVFHTVAHEAIEQLVGRSVFSSSPSLVEKLSGVRLDATDLYLSIWTDPAFWVHKPLVLVAYRPLRIALGLDESEKHFSVQQIAKSTRFGELLQQATELRHSNRERELTDLQKEAEIIEQRLDIFSGIMQGDKLLSIVPHPSRSDGSWLSIKDWKERFANPNEEQYFTSVQCDAISAQFAAMKAAYGKRDAEGFSKTASELVGSLRTLSPEIYPEESALAREISYNKGRPFGLAWLLYLPAALCGLLALKYRGRAVYMLAMGLFLGGLAMHIYGFALRCLIAGRPPVSNMYESVVWVGFGAVFFGLIFELIYRRRYYMVCGATAGFLCLVLMDEMPVLMGNVNAPGFEAQIKPLVPVLRDNFWLTIHVLTITLGYSAFMLAWFLGHVALVCHLFYPGQKTLHHELHSFVYRALQVGVLLLATGTILGGVWAYYSWGRFWGWDPKETWAFIALMCYLIVLHGRYAGAWGNFGLAVGAVVCFQAVVMAWYGVNFVLGSGLHAYGTGAGGKVYVLSLIGIDALFTAAAIARKYTFKTNNIDLI